MITIRWELTTFKNLSAVIMLYVEDFEIIEINLLWSIFLVIAHKRYDGNYGKYNEPS